MAKVKQVGLLAAGCQPWNKDVCAASRDRFAYCATLAIYIYQVCVFLLLPAVSCILYVFTLNGDQTNVFNVMSHLLISCSSTSSITNLN